MTETNLFSDQLNELANRAGVKFFYYQEDTFAGVQTMGENPRLCLYYKTGAGKSLTALVSIILAGHDEALVIAPPSTHLQWIALGGKLGVKVETMSHATFRMKETKVSRTKPIIADEFHLFGGHSGKGWQKFDRLARSIKAPLVLASATPNYNDADRVYCIQHVLDPHSCKGGFLEFIYAHCTTQQNPFGRLPIVTGFRNFPEAKDYLAALPGVFYLEDDLTYTVIDRRLPGKNFPEMDTFGLDLRRHRVIASQIEERHARVIQSLVDKGGFIYDEVYDELTYLVGQASTPALIYANHSTVADALGRTLHAKGVKHEVVTGDTPAKKKAASIAAFLDGALDVLVGTATLATGTDGMDKVCDLLIILDDTDDASLRRQLIGRIMPRGEGGDATTKQVYRILLPQ